MKIDRGKYEKIILSSKAQEEREGLPEGVGLEPSPFWDFQSSPYNLFKHMVRYFFIAEEIWKAAAEMSTPLTLKVLDIGSGYGEMKVFLSQYMRPKGYSLKYVGCDIDPLRIERAKAYQPHIDIRPMGPLPMGLGAIEGLFNFFICGEVYEHLHPKEAPLLFDEMRKISSPGALAVFTIPTPSYGKSRTIPMHINEIGPQEFIHQAEEYGWNIVKWYYLRGGVAGDKPKNIPEAMKGVYLAPQFSKSGKCALYVLRKDSI